MFAAEASTVLWQIAHRRQRRNAQHQVCAAPPCCRTKTHRCINMYARKWRRSLIPSSRPSASSDGNSERFHVLLFNSFLLAILGVLDLSFVSQSIRTLPPAQPAPAHFILPPSDASTLCLPGSLRCRLPRLSATLSSFLLLPLFQSALPVLQPSRFQRCFKNQADWELIFFYFYFFYLICFLFPWIAWKCSNTTGRLDLLLFLEIHLPSLHHNNPPDTWTKQRPESRKRPSGPDLTSPVLFCKWAPAWLQPDCIPAPPSLFFQDHLDRFTAQSTSPLVSSHHCDRVLPWKPFSQPFLFFL